MNASLPHNPPSLDSPSTNPLDPNDSASLEDLPDPLGSSTPRPTDDPSSSSILPGANDDPMSFDDIEDTDTPPTHMDVFSQLTRFRPLPTRVPHQPPRPNQNLAPHCEPQTARIQGWDSESVLQNLDLNQTRLWNETAMPKILVYVWEPHYRPGQVDLALALRKAVAKAVSIPEPDVGPPLAAQIPRTRPAPPYVFLVAKLSQTAADLLINKQCWSLPSITFFAIPFSPPAYPFICNIDHLLYDESESAEVLKLVINTITNSGAARACISRYNGNPNAFDLILKSMRIEPLRIGLPTLEGGGTRLTWNLYATPPSQNAKRNGEWRRTVASLTFVTALHGAGTANRPLGPCSGCRSLDHPRGLCPFPLTDNWSDPPTLSAPGPNTSRGRGQKRGNARNAGCGGGRGANREGLPSLNYG
jgi:hypothetical protein